MGIVESAKRALGQRIGVVGGALSKISGGKVGETLRAMGGQMTGGTRKFNIVPPAHAAEQKWDTDVPREIVIPSNIPQDKPQPQPQPQPQPDNGDGGGMTDSDPGGFGSFDNPDLSNPYKRNRYEQARAMFSAGGGESAEDAARRAAEERMRRYGEVVAPVQRDIESYLSGRPDITSLFQEQLTTQGVPTKQSALGLLEKEQTKLGEQLASLPGEEITRRKETGMLTAAAERRIRAMEEAPIREQLLKTSSAKEAERIGLDRAYQLVDKYLDVLREQEQREREPLEFRLESAKGEFGEEVKGIADKLTGFNRDREAKLKLYEDELAAGQQLNRDQAKEAADLKLQEAKHLNTMEESTARQKGEDPTFTDPDQLEAFKVDALTMGSEELTEKYGDVFGIASLNWLLKKYAATIPNNEAGGGSGI